MIFVRILVLILILNNLTNLSAGETQQINYMSFVDPGYGFYKVRDITTNKPAPFDINNHTLTINQNDIITWKSDADTNVKLTIISDQDLWDKDKSVLGAPFNYTFPESGTYTFHIKEYSGKLIVIVNPNNIPDTPTGTAETTPIVEETTVVTPIPTLNPTPTYTYGPDPTISTPVHNNSTSILPPIKIMPGTIISTIVVIIVLIITFVSKNN